MQGVVSGVEMPAQWEKLMEHITFEAEDADAVIQLLVEFIEDIYSYLNITLPEDLDPEVELVRIVQAIKDKQNGNG
jgi:hypothetical protein